MKVLFRGLLAAALLTSATGCDKFLDINTNPNSPTELTANFILANALATTAANYNGGIANGQNYNSYSSWAVGYLTKSGVVSGYGEEQTYNYSTAYYQNLWTNTYDNLYDYQLIQQQAAAYPRHAAIARIMKAYNFLLLVDQYGDIPYSEALKGTANTTPSYDRAQDIYKDLVEQLKGAVSDINAIASDATPIGTEDVVFAGNMTRWKQFANSLRLRILLRESQTSDAALNTYVQSEMTALQGAADGFIDRDVIVQPGYSQNANQQNPFYNRYGFNSAGSSATERNYQIPTNFIIRQYTQNNDPRITQLYATGSNNGVTGYVGGDLGERSPASFTAPVIASRLLSGGTFLRSAAAPTILMLVSEHYFNKAEAETRSLFTGGDAAAKTDYDNGIKSSFQTTYRTATTLASPATVANTTQYDQYVAANTTNAKVNYDLATRNGALGKQSVIIFQKYLAMNIVASTEAWDDYRRTAQPQIPISLQVTQNVNNLPKRLLYPQSEINTNSAKVPSGVTQFTKIFWDVVD